MVSPPAARDVTHDFSDVGLTVPTPPQKTEYAHVGTLDGTAIEHPKRSEAKAKRYGSYLVRAPPYAQQGTSSTTTNQAISTHQNGRQAFSRLPGDTNKRFAVLDPLVEESLQRTLTQQDRLSCIKPPADIQARPNPASPPLANPGQRQSVSRFTKELERYCMAANANGAAPLPLSTPTVSESPTTLDTVTELLPYHKQFKAAGLAITSREQMPRIPEYLHSQLPEIPNENPRILHLASSQVDGSTTAASGRGSSPSRRAAHAVPDNAVGVPLASQGCGQTLPFKVPTTTKSLIPWFRKKSTTPVSRVHSRRKISSGHIHPSQATPAEPYLSPSDRLRLIDSYFDTPESSKPQARQGAAQHTSLSPSGSSKKSSIVDKPLPKQPSIKRRPIPPRSERRHMPNTADWPTAGVLIHDSSLHPGSSDMLPPLDGRPSAYAKESSSACSRAAREHSPEAHGRTPKVSSRMVAGTKETYQPRNSTIISRDDLAKENDPTQERSNHLDNAKRERWYKTTSTKRRTSSKPRPVSSTIREVHPDCSIDAREPSPNSSSPKIEVLPISSVPQLPATLPFSVETSSLEKALDAVISKLDAMEERRRNERALGPDEAVQLPVPKPEPLQKLSSSEPSTEVSSAPRSGRQASIAAPRSDPASDAIEYLDSDINDRDILVGLKMAICAACDEDLDAWIRNKTGLRLRRFLADLKAFESVSRDRKPLAPQPLSRRIRRHDREGRRLQAERARRKRSSKKAWTPCFGADGAGSLKTRKLDNL